MTLDFEKEKLVSELERLKPKKVLVQLPEGIKQHAIEIAKIIESLGIEVIISGETCWGGCCVNPTEAQASGADLIVHFGHAEFVSVKFPVLYIEVKDILDLNPILEKSLGVLEKYNSIGFSFSVQHLKDIPDIVKFYESKGKKIILSKKKGLVAYEGHIVGCQYEGLKAIQDEVDAFVILGNNFHSMGAAIAVEKPVILLDVYNNEVKEMVGVRDKILKQRVIAIEKLKEAKKVGIISEIKIGQKFGLAHPLIEKLKKSGKEVISIKMDEMTNEKIMNFYDIDCFIELACPRIAVDDFAKYDKPIVTYREALIALDEKTWEEALEEGLL